MFVVHEILINHIVIDVWDKKHASTLKFNEYLLGYTSVMQYSTERLL